MSLAKSLGDRFRPAIGRPTGADLLAGAIVAVMLVPQGMAYAMLAGLPPHVGLYASIAPPAVYAVFGSSRSLAVGPVAIVSLLVASGIGPLAAPGSAEYMALAIVLAAASGILLTILGGLRLGGIVNLLSHPVLAGFTVGAALLIGLSQVSHLLGIPADRTHGFFITLLELWSARAGWVPETAAIGVATVILLLFGGRILRAILGSLGLGETLASGLSRTLPLAAVVGGILAVRWGGLDSAGVAIVGSIPGGLPPITMPSIDPGALPRLIPSVLAITFVGFMESFAVAQALAARHRDRIDPNRELMALGASNIAAALTGGYPVTGGFSRSVVNDDAGARSRWASGFTAALVLLTLTVFTPLLYHLPRAVLAAVVIVAVARLIDPSTLLQIWRYSRADGIAALVSLAATLLIGVEVGILLGVGTSLLLYTWRTSTPHVAVVGRVPGTEHYRNVLRHDVITVPQVLAIRVDENLYFANARFLERWILKAVADRPEVDDLVLICSAVSFVDASAADTLERLSEQLQEAGVRLHLAEVKGPVMDRLQGASIPDSLSGGVYLSVHEAIEALGYPTGRPADADHPAPSPRSVARRTADRGDIA